MAFLFVDRILSSEPGQTITGIKHVGPQDAFVYQSAGKMAFLPSIVGETLGQLAAWNVMQHLDFKVRPVAGVASDIEMLAPVTMGETLFLEATIDSIDERAVRYHGYATVGDRVVLRIGQALGPLLPMEDFIDTDEVIGQFKRIDRPGTWQPSLEASHSDLSLSRQFNQFQDGYDTVHAFQPGERATATKVIAGTAPYFSDHFPRNPVFPMTLLLNANIELGHFVLADEDCVVRKIRKAKMNKFVRPGDMISTDCRLKSRDDSHFILEFRTSVDGERVCVAEAEYVMRDAL